MGKKKKVFVRGCKGRGDEIKEILTGLGATNAYEVSCEDENSVYFINRKNEISVALIDSEVGALIMDNYKEIELPQQWKDGDILVDDGDPKSYAVFKEYNKEFNAFRAYFILNNKTAYFDTPANVGHYHLASAEEIKSLPLLFCFLMGKLNDAGLCLLKKS